MLIISLELALIVSFYSKNFLPMQEKFFSKISLDKKKFLAHFSGKNYNSGKIFEWEISMESKFLKRFMTVLFCLTVIFFDFNSCSAENLKFIDAREDLGYYFDADSVKIRNDKIFNVNLIVIRADSNQMEVTDLEINHAEKVYTIKSTKTLSYSDRTEISADYQKHLPHSYSDKSLMSELVLMILYGGE